jgi:hypothetical protein
MLLLLAAMVLLIDVRVVDAEHTCMHNHLRHTHPPLQPHLHRSEQAYSNEVTKKKNQTTL